MRMFSEEVNITLTRSNLNIITVENFNEIFFDVFELEINGNNYVAEKVSEYNGRPVVSIPVYKKNSDEEPVKYPFILNTGPKFSVIFNENNTTLVAAPEKNITTITEIVESHKNDIVHPVVADNLVKEEKLNLPLPVPVLSNEEIQRVICAALDEARIALVEDFYNTSDKHQQLLEKVVEGIEERLILNIESVSDSKSTEIANVAETANKVSNKIETVTKQLTELVDKTKVHLSESIKKGDEDRTSLIKKFFNDVDQHQQELKESLQVTEEKILKDSVDQHNAISELTKNTNRALSRIGTVKNQLSDLVESTKSELAAKIDRNEKLISEKYDEILALVPNVKVLIESVQDSKNVLIDDIGNTTATLIERADPKKIDDLKKDIEKSINTRFSQELIKLKSMMEMYAGGGSVAQQFAAGGTMNGNLIVVGTLSASSYLGLEVAEYESVYTTVNTNSALWGSGGVAVPQTLVFNESTGMLSITAGNAVSLSALSGRSVAETDPKFTTWAQTYSAKYESNYTTVNANSASWATGSYNGNDIKVLSANWQSTWLTVSANSSSWGYQGNDVKDLSSNWQTTWLTVNTNSASWATGSYNGNDIKDLSANWQSTWLTVGANSASWNYQGNDLKNLSANWQTTWSTTNTLSSSWNYQGNDLKDLSANWQSAWATTNTSSGTWNYQGSDIKALTANWQTAWITTNTSSANWQTTWSTVNANSAVWDYRGNDLKDLSANWQTTWITVNANSSSWGYQGNDLKSLSANWETTWLTVNANSALWDYRGNDLKDLSANWQTTWSTTNSNSANWQTTWLTVSVNSGLWDYRGNDLKDLSANWQSTWLTVSANSSLWGYQGNDLKSLSANWQSTYTTVNSNSSVWSTGGTGAVINNYSSLTTPRTFNPGWNALSAESDSFTLPNSNSVQIVTHNGQTLDDNEYSQSGTTLTVTPENGFENLTDEILVFQSTFATAASGVVFSISTKTTNYTVQLTDYTILVDSTSSDITITLPPASVASGSVYNIKKIVSANNVIVEGDAAETIDGGLNATLTIQYESITLQCDGSQWWIL